MAISQPLALSLPAAISPRDCRQPPNIRTLRWWVRWRAALKTFARLLPRERAKSLGRELRWLAGVLGAVRDADVYGANIVAYLGALSAKDAAALGGYQAHLANRRRDARETLLQTLDGERYRRLVEDGEAFAHAGPEPGFRRRFGDLTIGYGASALVRKPIDKMLRQGERIDDTSPVEALHKLRIQGKRVRYQTEFFAPFYPRIKHFLVVCRDLQDVLGEHQDAAVACDRLRRYADSVPPGDGMRSELVALGQLVQIQARHRAEERKRFAPHWRRFVKAAAKLDL